MWRFKRNLEKSLKKYILDNILADWSNINVGLSFNYDEKELPFIACRIDSATHSKLELGTTILYTVNLAIIDLYCTGEAQRLDLAEYLVDKLKEGFIYYEFSPNPEDLENPIMIANGRIYVKIVGDVKVDLGENSDKCDKHRHRITLELEKN